jgi:acyl dehydratase
MTNVQVGHSVSVTRTVVIADFQLFATLSGDKNPIHTDPEFAAKTRFGRIIAPGLLIGSFISAAIANDLPGAGSIYLSQSLNFLRPVFEGDTVRIILRIEEIVRAGVCRLSTVCENGTGEIVINGEAVVKYPN